ncbi:MAG: NAD(P)/FAD-dependent oxidoreductase [Planctomycetia bacterium]
MADCCIIGGGIVGLSIARELAGRGLSVRVLTRESGRDTASWAAAGIFPPAPEHPAATANEKLTSYSDRLHRTWAEELREETGIDNELQPCGGLHLAADERGTARLCEAEASWIAKGTRCDRLTARDVAAHEPALQTAVERGRIIGGLLLPEEMRIRPPRHLEALRESCRLRGVEITPAAEVRAIDMRDGRIESLGIATGAATETVRADRYCLAAGAWSGRLAESLGLHIDTRPIRGQIALLRLPRQVLARVVNVGLDYLVPRADGRLLVGSTLEDAGFDKATTPQTIARLLAFAHHLMGPLPDAVVEQSWAGLRPGSVDGLPFIGPAPACGNAFVATGHFRAGLHQSTGTAVLLADLMTGGTPALDLEPCAPGRRPGPASPDSVPAYLARAAAEASA